MGGQVNVRLGDDDDAVDPVMDVLLAQEGQRGAGLQFLGNRLGIELEQRWVDATHTMLATNGLADRSSVDLGNLYDLTRADVEATGASLVVCCEVVEHVPDPDEAVRTLARALPEGTDLHNDDAVEAGIREILDEQGYTEVDDDSPRGDLRVAAK